jgi:hypothetical protein
VKPWRIGETRVWLDRDQDKELEDQVKCSSKEDLLQEEEECLQVVCHQEEDLHLAIQEHKVTLACSKEAHLQVIQLIEDLQEIQLAISLETQIRLVAKNEPYLKYK